MVTTAVLEAVGDLMLGLGHVYYSEPTAPVRSPMLLVCWRSNSTSEMIELDECQAGAGYPVQAMH